MEWIPGYAKLFMCHLASEKAFVTEVKAALLDRGIDAFVAHDDINPSRVWESEIEEALQTCDAAALFLHDGFHESDWTDQETGFCVARGVLIIPLRFDLDPYGFTGRYQGAACTSKAPEVVADIILDAMLGDSRTRYATEDGIIEAVATSGSFKEANKRSFYLSRVKDLNIAHRVKRLTEALGNSQVDGGFNAAPTIRAILARYPLDDAPPF